MTSAVGFFARRSNVASIAHKEPVSLHPLCRTMGSCLVPSSSSSPSISFRARATRDCSAPRAITNMSRGPHDSAKASTRQHAHCSAIGSSIASAHSMSGVSISTPRTSRSFFVASGSVGRSTSKDRNVERSRPSAKAVTATSASVAPTSSHRPKLYSLQISSSAMLNSSATASLRATSVHPLDAHASIARVISSSSIMASPRAAPSPRRLWANGATLRRILVRVQVELRS